MNPGFGPSNAVLGNASNYGMDLPHAQVDDTQFKQAQNVARYSKTAEFKKLKAHLEDRIKFYQENLPGGQPVSDVDPKIAGAMWVANNAIIKELQAIITVYEDTVQFVKDETARRQAAQGSQPTN